LSDVHCSHLLAGEGELGVPKVGMSTHSTLKKGVALNQFYSRHFVHGGRDFDLAVEHGVFTDM
jgi:hypothetical protein